MPKPTLLQLAKESKISSNKRWGQICTKEHVELAISWALGEIGTNVVGEVLGYKRNASSNVSYALSQIFKYAIFHGYLVSNQNITHAQKPK